MTAAPEGLITPLLAATRFACRPLSSVISGIRCSGMIDKSNKDGSCACHGEEQDLMFRYVCISVARITRSDDVVIINATNTQDGLGGSIGSGRWFR